ncbi:MAG: class I SAM-dependent DNA methyltransferase [Caldilineaceae bacterium]|nr:class I SAM-dependent DNA methyltransferase [Caldilineaceae bacterium]
MWKWAGLSGAGRQIDSPRPTRYNLERRQTADDRPHTGGDPGTTRGPLSAVCRPKPTTTPDERSFMPISPQQFVHKWRGVSLKERSAAQEHFLDICHLIGHPTPAEDDPTGQRFTFEAGADKQSGGSGWADVWKRGFFAWEYKGKHADLGKAYQQLLQYRESLLNPPLLVVSDIERIVVHTNFTNTVKQTVEIGLDDLLTPGGMAQLRAIFSQPERFQSSQTVEQVTEQAAREFARLAALLREQTDDAHAIAHFLIRLLFCLFAEDIDLLPRNLFGNLVDHTRGRPHAFTGQLGQLFQAMATGGWFGAEEIKHFNGGLFDSAAVLPLDRTGLDVLAGIASLDWSSIEPSILGTLFERSLDPAKRAQLGAHYTSREDILLIVEPVLMAPLRRRWAEVQTEAQALAARRDATSDRGTATRHNNALAKLLQDFAADLAATRVLDPACGSGNFLYVALRLLLDLWKEVSVFAGALRLPLLSPVPGLSPSPEQLYGIELNPFAYELAQATIWIGYIQWLHENGFGLPGEPILKPLDNIANRDAILAYDAAGNPVEPVWPDAEIVIGNPPFLGDKKMRADLGGVYTDTLRKLYGERIPGQSDLVCYWFEKARQLLADGSLSRAGLLATQGIRGGANRTVLERIKETGDIFWAESDRNWILDGATVHVSMISFDGGSESNKVLNGESVDSINADLTALADVTSAQRLEENSGIAFIGTQKGGKFDISPDLAEEMLAQPPNPNGASNSDVIRPWINGRDIVQRPRRMYIIDFGTDTDKEVAALYEAPFEYLRQNIKTTREEVNSEGRTATIWWLHQRSRPEMRTALEGLPRFIGTPRVAKHRMFVWVESAVLADSAVVVFARADDYFMGVLHSSIHEFWARATGTQLRDAESGFRYSQTMTFETFPFPWPPGAEPVDDPRVQAIAAAAAELVARRDAWLNPPGLDEAQLKKRTLTNLYNQRPTWLDLLHKRLDAAVSAAYGWPADTADEEILERLLALNLERAGG